MKTILLIPLLLALASPTMAAPGPETPAQRPPPNAAAARVAIIINSSSFSEAADLLTAELSRQEGVQLLERTEIQKVYREQGLSAANKDTLKLGQILGADGLLLLQAPIGGASDSLEVRLVAVRPGVVIGAIRSPWPVQDAAQWAAGLAKHFELFLPKLSVPAHDAVPLSVVSIQSAIQGTGSEELERQAMLLCIERLSRQRELFVLERRRLELLSTEKELQTTNESAFWNGSYLLQGVLDRDGYSKETVTLSARLLPPKGAAPLAFELRSSRTNLSALVDQLAAKIIQNLNLAGAPPWNPAEEAGKYFQEGKWAYHWGLLPEAAAACEAGWALGLQNKDLAELRIRSYADDGVDRALGWFDLQRKLVSFGPSSKPVRGQFVMPVEPIYGCGLSPDSARFARVHRAMELFRQDFRNFILNDPNPGWAWHDLGLDLLENASYWLRHYYYTPEARVGNEETITGVQSLANEIAGLLGTHPAFTNDFGRPKFFNAKVNWGPERLGASEQSHKTLAGLETIWGAYWAATPEQGLVTYRRLLQSGLLAKVRRSFLSRALWEKSTISDPLQPLLETPGGSLDAEPLDFLAGWQWEQRKRAPAVWRNFIDELCASATLSTKQEGLFLQSAQALTDAQHDQAFRALLALLELHQSELLAPGKNQELPADIDALLTPQMRDGFQPAALQARKDLWQQFKQRLGNGKDQLGLNPQIEEMKKYLAGSDYDFAPFARLFLRGGLEQPDARVLLPALAQYRSNLTFRVAALGREIAAGRPQDTFASRDLKNRLQSSGLLLDQLEQTLKSKLAKPVSVASSPGSPPIASPPQRYAPPGGAMPALPGFLTGPSAIPGQNPAQAGSRPPVVPGGRPPGFAGPAGNPSMPRGAGPAMLGTDPSTLLLTNVLEVSRFFRLPDHLPGATNEPVAFSPVTSCYREGRFWLETRYDRLGTFAGSDTYFNRGAFFCVDPVSFAYEIIPLDPRSFILSKRDFNRPVERMFEVFKGWLYVSSVDAVRRYSLRDKVWENLPVPVSGHARFSVIAERLFLCTEDSIFELAADGKEARILASSRRRPPLTALDSVDGYACPPLVRGSQGQLLALVGGHFYEQAADGKDWKTIAGAPDLAEGDCAVFDAGLLATSGIRTRDKCLFALFDGSISPELLLVQPLYPSNFPLPATRPSPGRALHPRWPLPAGVHALDYPVCLEGQALWVFAGSLASSKNPAASLGSRQPADAHAVLFQLQAQDSKPFAVPVSFQLPETHSARGLQFREQVVFDSTPHGLLVASSFIPGFWLIPQSALAGRLKEWQAAGKPEIQVPPAATPAGSSL